MPVHAARHEVVHQVVARGHVREDAADPPCLLVGGTSSYRKKPCPWREPLAGEAEHVQLRSQAPLPRSVRVEQHRACRDAAVETS
jgi:hypothetical protein